MIDRWTGGLVSGIDKPLGGTEDITSDIKPYQDVFIRDIVNRIDFSQAFKDFEKDLAQNCSGTNGHAFTEPLGQRSFNLNHLSDKEGILYETHTVEDIFGPDIHKGLGGFHLQYSIDVTMTFYLNRHCEVEAVANVSAHLRIINTYDFNPGGRFRIPTFGTLTSEWLNQGLEWGLAENFEMRADWSASDVIVIREPRPGRRAIPELHSY